MGFTDHDRDLEMDGVVCRAGSGWSAGTGDLATGLEADARFCQYCGAALPGHVSDSQVPESRSKRPEQPFT